MSYYWREKLILAMKEVTYGTDPGPTPALNMLRTFDFDFDPFNAENITVEEDKPKPGADQETLVGRHGVLRFSTYAASVGAGNQGDVPPLDPLFAGCGYEGAPDDVGTPTLYKYTQVFPATDSLTFYCDIGGVLHKFVGSRGTVEFNTQKRNFPRFNWTFTGLFVPVAASALDGSTADTTAFLKALPFRAALVDVSLHGNTIACHSLTITSGENVEFYEHSETELIDITDRDSRFQLRLEEPDIGTFDIWAVIEAETMGALSYVHGTTAGEIIEITASQAQPTAPSKNEEQGRTALDIEGPLVGNSTNDYKAVEFIFR